MSTFVLIHGAGDAGWNWHLVEAELRGRGHDVVAPDLPGDDESATLVDYAEAVVAAVGDRQDLIVVGHSFGAFTAPLVADRLAVDVLILLAGMVPAPGESPDEWWDNTGYLRAVEQQAGRDGGLTGNADPHIGFYHDVPRHLADEALARERAHPSPAAMAAPWPLEAWPEVSTRFLLCAEDRCFPPGLFRRLVPERLGIVPDEIAGGHCVPLSRPGDLVDALEGYAAEPRPSGGWLSATRTSYDADAGGYAEQVRGLLDANPYLRASLALFADLVHEAGGGTVADVGCGPGYVTRHLVDLGVDAFGLDLSPEMVAIARRDHPGLRFEVGTMTDLDLPDRSVGGVLAFWSVIHVPDDAVPEVFAQFHRVLRPGGPVLVGFHVGDGARHTSVGYTGRAISVVDYLRSPDQVAGRLREAGFTVEAELLLRPEDEIPGAVVIARRPR